MPAEEMPVELVEELAAAEEVIEEYAPIPAVESQSVDEVKQPLVAQHEDRPVVLQDETINYRVQLHPSETVGLAALIDAIQRQGDFGKRVHWLGMNSLTGGWEEVGQGSAKEYLNIAATLQLADRTGPVSDSDLAAFCSQVQTVADELVAVAEFPKRQPALALAAALDQFCADVDVLIGANIITQNGVAFAATKVRAMAEAAGMKLQPDARFTFSTMRVRICSRWPIWIQRHFQQTTSASSAPMVSPFCSMCPGLPTGARIQPDADGGQTDGLLAWWAGGGR